ncbi:hypothetical protein, partial [Pyrobaculum sp.]|uniref:hypothetical protein n=1 Tax=Pyrobaculum sp. TaxID=2004705 RepID=UPI003160E14E
MDITFFLLLAGGLSALYLLLFRGDEEWYVPIAGAALSVLAPLVIHLVFSALVPFAESPVYVYGVLDVERHLEWAYEQIHKTAEAAFFAAEAALYAMEGAYAALTAALAVVAALTAGVGTSVVVTAL